MALITQSDLEAKLKRNLSSEEQTAFTVINAAMQAHVENIIGSSVEEEDESNRFYDGGFRDLIIDPCTSISAVKEVDDNFNVVQTFNTEDYIEEPHNRTLKTRIHYRLGKFPPGPKRIQVSAKFSIFADTDTLNIVKDALLNALVSEISTGTNIKSEKIEGYSIEYATTQSQDSLDKLRYIFPRII